MIAVDAIRLVLQCDSPSCDCHKPTGHVHCPAHADSTPSLSVTEQGDKILVKCFGGCSQDRVIAALKEKGLWPSRSSGRPAFKVAKTYDYLDSAGKLVYQVCRLDPKDFRQRRPDPQNPEKWLWNLKRVKRLPYRLPELLKAEAVFICEGEKDCDQLVALGLVATTNPGGAGKWRPDFSGYFQDKKVIILPDADDVGRAHAEQVAQNLRGVVTSLKVIEVPGLPEKGDVSDWLAAGGTVEQLLALVDATQEWTPPADDGQDYQQAEREAIREEAQAPKFPDVISAADLQNLVFPEIEYLIEDIMPLGFGLLSARPKKGKSYLALNISVAKTTGGCALGNKDLRLDKGTVLYIAYEDKNRRVKNRLTTIMKGKHFPHKLYVAETWPRIPDGGLDRLDKWLTSNPDTRMVVIDTLGRFKPRKRPRQDDYEADLATGAALADLAHKHNVCILGVYHNRKTASDDPLDDVHGSTGMTAAADFVMVLRRGRGQANAELFVTGRDIEEKTLALLFHKAEGLWELLGTAEEVAKSQSRKDICLILKEHGPVNTKKIAEIIDKKVDTIKKLLNRMKGDNEVRFENGKWELM